MSTFFCDVLFLLLLSLSKHCFQDSNEISAYTRSQTRATAGRHINSFIARPTSDAQLFQLRVRETTSKHARLSRIERIRKQILFPIVHLPFSLSLSLSLSLSFSLERTKAGFNFALSLSSFLARPEWKPRRTATDGAAGHARNEPCARVWKLNDTVLQRERENTLEFGRELLARTVVCYFCVFRSVELGRGGGSWFGDVIST